MQAVYRPPCIHKGIPLLESTGILPETGILFLFDDGGYCICLGINRGIVTRLLVETRAAKPPIRVRKYIFFSGFLKFHQATHGVLGMNKNNRFAVCACFR